MIKKEIQEKKAEWVVTSLPLSLKRERQRGYNQAAALAKSAARRLDLSYLDLLIKAEERPRQSELEYSQRYENVKGVFRSNQSLRGLSVILVDDILTSGATLFSATETLTFAGAVRVLSAVVASGRKKEQNVPLILP